MTDMLIQAKNLVRHYPLGRHRILHALDGVDLGVARGATLGLVGGSGSGKSTLGRILVGLQKPSLGNVLFEGKDTATPERSFVARLRRERQIIFQDPSGALNPRMTVGATVVEHLRVQGWSRADARRQAAAAIEQAGLATAFMARYPHEISGGQRQRAVIARAISTDPAFIVADEPVSALDVSTRAQIMNLLRQLQAERGLTMLFISHDLSVVAHMCSDVAVMHLGRIVERAPRAVLFRMPRHPYTAALLSAIPIPDPARERRRARIILKGETPNPADKPSGCSFHTRCPRATELCRGIDPPLQPIGLNHQIACHHPLE
ncbi:ATP-binding cassette domain-containing protein [Nordella sp. HKS 07]|uniref:oligopeptide/dipeptide ABC transporter ATP-binding protein n=1 Tax=Nordella sp. HKS 07 TaxID=2712222 RepID=UPI0013E1DEE1|nr:oligopeptide/dipeptide ABC transporter ATP-binding protein [Nordella sp. HKS 07]QIG52030.1 ATP-binding cassette domain-containing protein [Nordella sp. HKS 07]